MSFDVFFQRFRDGDAAPAAGAQMYEVLKPYVVREEPESNFALVEYGDGSADVYLVGDHMMASRVSGGRPWDLLVAGARAADWVIMPVGCPTCITAETQQDHRRTASMTRSFSSGRAPSCSTQSAPPSADRRPDSMSKGMQRVAVHRTGWREQRWDLGETVHGAP